MTKPPPPQKTVRKPDGSFETILTGHNYKTHRPATIAEIEAFEDEFAASTPAEKPKKTRRGTLRAVFG